MTRSEAEHPVPVGIESPLIEYGCAATHEVLVRRGCLQPDAIPARYASPGERQPGAAHGFQGGQQIRLVATMVLGANAHVPATTTAPSIKPRCFMSAERSRATCGVSVGVSRAVRPKAGACC